MNERLGKRSFEELKASFEELRRDTLAKTERLEKLVETESDLVAANALLAEEVAALGTAALTLVHHQGKRKHALASASTQPVKKRVVDM